MSNTKAAVEVKQEGEFTLKGKSKPRKPKQLGNKEQEIPKVNIKEPLVEVEPDVKKVEIKNEEIKKEDDAIQIGETEKVSVEKPSGDSTEVGEPVQESNETTEGFSPIQEVTEEEVKQEVKQPEVKPVEQPAVDLPENVEKLVSFMKETGGTVEDYVRLNADYSNIDEKALLKEYYKKNKPHLDAEDVDLILEDFTWDTEQQKAMDFFNRYNKQQEQAEQLHTQFKQSTKQLFSDQFKGFDFEVGGKKYKYNIQNRDAVAENQSNINNLIGKFLDADGSVVDPAGYHKAMYAAENVDKIATHFYEQGKADAVKDVVNKSKNLSDVKARQGNTGEVFIGGMKVKSISGADSTKLKIKTRKFN